MIFTVTTNELEEKEAYVKMRGSNFSSIMLYVTKEALPLYPLGKTFILSEQVDFSCGIHEDHTSAEASEACKVARSQDRKNAIEDAEGPAAD